MVILAPSILSADFTILGQQMKQAEEGRCDYFHFDVMDGMFVPNISFGLPVLKSIRKATDRIIDVHLMVVEPERYIDRFIDAGADIITVHEEACKPLADTIEQIHKRGKKAGIAIKPGTDISVLEPYIGKADMFLVMTVEPGFGGQKYNDMCTEKVRSLRRMTEEAGLDTDIEVDGGITRDNVSVVLEAGANVIVMGSSIFDGDITADAKYFREVFDKWQKENSYEKLH